MNSTPHVFGKFWRLLGIVALFLAGLGLVMFLEQTAWGQIRTRSSSAGASGDILTYVRWAGLAVALVVIYLLSFHLLFPTMLRGGTWPLTAYGTCWAIFFGVSTLVVLGLMWADLMPDRVTRRTSSLHVYMYHLIVLGVGFVLCISSLGLLRSRHKGVDRELSTKK